MLLPAARRRMILALSSSLVAVVALAGCGSGASSGPATSGGSSGASSDRPVAHAVPADAASLAPATPVSGLPTVEVARLPAQAVDTLRLIAAGGPYPFAKDGVTFSNREGILPGHPSGWYQEYTVITPGSSDRGARRVIAGRDGGRFYTDDHYASFGEVVSGVTS